METQLTAKQIANIYDFCHKDGIDNKELLRKAIADLGESLFGLMRHPHNSAEWRAFEDKRIASERDIHSFFENGEAEVMNSPEGSKIIRRVTEETGFDWSKAINSNI